MSVNAIVQYSTFHLAYEATTTMGEDTEFRPTDSDSEPEDAIEGPPVLIASSFGQLGSTRHSRAVWAAFCASASRAYLADTSFTDIEDDFERAYAEIEVAELTSTSPYPLFTAVPETAERPWRGVFAARNPTEAISEDVLDLETSKLPRWRPQVTLTRRVLEEGDE